MSEILKIINLSGGYREGVNILHDISIEVQQGEAVGIIGLNGSGKSTFGKALIGMIPYRWGVIEFDGEDVTGFSTTKLAHRGISIMQQGGRVFCNLSVWDNLQLAAQGKAGQRSKVKGQLTEIIPLLQRPKKELQHLMADKLSGGQKHQLSLAMTLATNPKLVILDEPSAGLSPIAVEEMYHMLRDVRSKLNVTIILIEQNIAKALEFCDVCKLMDMGNFVHSLDKAYTNRIVEILFRKTNN